MQNPAFYGSWPLNLNQYAWSPEALQQYQNMLLTDPTLQQQMHQSQTHQAQPLQPTPLATSPATTTPATTTSITLPPTQPCHFILPQSSASLFPDHTTPHQTTTPHTKHSSHSDNVEARQPTLQSVTWASTFSPNSTHRLEQSTQCSRYGSSPSPSFPIASARPRGVCAEIAQRGSVHGTHSHQEYSRKRADVHAPQEHVREKPFHRRSGASSSWTDRTTRTIEKGPSHCIHATVGRQHYRTPSIHSTTPSQSTTASPNPPASGTARETDWEASNTWHPPHTREATSPPLQNFQSLRTLHTLPLRPTTATSHTTITRLPSRDTLTLTRTQPSTTSTSGTSRDTFHASPEGHNQTSTQKTAGLLPADTAIAIPTPLLQATPAWGPTSAQSRTISQPIALDPPWSHRWPQLRHCSNNIAASSHTTPRTGHSSPTHKSGLPNATVRNSLSMSARSPPFSPRSPSETSPTLQKQQSASAYQWQEPPRWLTRHSHNSVRRPVIWQLD